MQGLYVLADGGWRRPRSKKQVRELVAINERLIRIEATSVFGNEYDGGAADMPIGEPVTFVGPDPYTKRNFYGTLTRTAADKWTVK